MRLINIQTLELKEFITDPPHYAILSHRWSDDEISYKDFNKGRRQDSRGYRKVANFCVWLRGRIFAKCCTKSHHTFAVDWAWIDTCCIDKRSSAELSEAINSMFAWYANAAICVAFLEDVDDNGRTFGISDWWTRGWTLQELLAPDKVIFCSGNWKLLGHKCSCKEEMQHDEGLGECICHQKGTGMNSMHRLNDAIVKITGIAGDFLSGGGDRVCSPSTSAAVKMSWAADRVTTRPEDLAYCLMGIFQVNMPLLYGEGKDAFRRLQMAILERDNDQSLFAFTAPPIRGGLNPLFADSPQKFQGLKLRREQSLTPPIQIKQSILCMEAEVEHSLNVRLPYWREIFIIRLNCRPALSNDEDHARRRATSQQGSSSAFELALSLSPMSRARTPMTSRQITRLFSDTVLFKVNVQEELADKRPLWQIIPLDERQNYGRRQLYIHAAADYRL